MNSRTISTVLYVVSFWLGALSALPNGIAQSTRGNTRQIGTSGATSFPALADGDDAIQAPEFVDEDADGNILSGIEDPNNPRSFVNRSLSGPTRGNGRIVSPSRQAKSNPELKLSFDGLNFRQQRLANGGNQFSVEPPDQGMCVGNGFVLESVNDVIRVFDTSGAPATGVVDLNTFYGYPPAINRTTGARGPFVTDPSCLFDPTTQRFIHVVLTLDVSTTGTFLGTNHIDIAVSNTPDPRASWTIYRLPAQDDGTEGTPDHNCPGACLGDYPHIGADASGIYITTNEYEFFGNAFKGAQIYAFSKGQLTSQAASVAVTQFDTSHAAPSGKPGFTVRPAQTPGNQFQTANGGTEYFLSSTAADEAQCDSGVVCTGTGASSNVLVWSLSGTSSLDTAVPSLSLSSRSVTVAQYAVPPKSNQKPGDFPQGQCINDTSTVITSLGTPFTGCWKALFLDEPAHDEVISHLDSDDTRVQQVAFANGKLWGALNTDVTVNGEHKAGIEYFVINPVSGKLGLQGTLALAGNNLIYPEIAVTASGRGVMAFTLVGDNYYPSAGYAGLDEKIGAGDIHISATGLGPDDGFTSYKAQVGNPPRTRWGDYGAAAVDGGSIWIASEYIAQTCTLAQYIAAPFGSCGGTRATLGNWATRISKVTP
jgi:hypothetical protein